MTTMNPAHRYSFQRGTDTIEAECRCPAPDSPQCAGAGDQDFNDWLASVLKPGHRIARTGIRVWLNGQEIEQF